MVASFHCCGTSPPVHTSTRMAWKRSRTMGSVGSLILSSSATRESGPSAFQLCIPRIARLVFSSVGADPSGTESPVVGAAGRCCTSSMMAGFSLGHLVLIEMCKSKISPPLLKYWQYVQAMAARVFVGVVNSQRCKNSSSCTFTAVHIQLRYASLVNAVGGTSYFGSTAVHRGCPFV